MEYFRDFVVEAVDDLDVNTAVQGGLGFPADFDFESGCDVLVGFAGAEEEGVADEEWGWCGYMSRFASD